MEWDGAQAGMHTPAQARERLIPPRGVDGPATHLPGKARLAGEGLVQQPGSDLRHLQACLRPLTAQPGTLTANSQGQGELLTRMLGSLSECLARVMASSVTRVSPLAWISSTAI